MIASRESWRRKARNEYTTKLIRFFGVISVMREILELTRSFEMTKQ